MHTPLSHCSGPWCRKAWVLDWWKCHRQPVRQNQMRRLQIPEPDSSTWPTLFSPQHLSVPTTIRAQFCACNHKSNPWDAPEMHKKRKQLSHAKRKIECNCKPFSMQDTPHGRTQPATIDCTPPPRTDAVTGLGELLPVEPSPICTSHKRSNIKCDWSITQQKSNRSKWKS